MTTLAVGATLVLIGVGMILVGFHLSRDCRPTSGVPLALIFGSYLPLTVGILAVIVPLVDVP